MLGEISRSSEKVKKNNKTIKNKIKYFSWQKCLQVFISRLMFTEMKLMINRKLKLFRVKYLINIRGSHWIGQFILNIGLNKLTLCS